MSSSGLFFVIILVITFFRSFDDMHKFQQNSYRVKRYFRWKNDALSRWIKPHEILYLIGMSLIFLVPSLISQVVGLFLVLVDFYFFNLIKSAQMSKKPLAFTARVKRLTVTDTLIIYIGFSFLGAAAHFAIGDLGYGLIALVYLFSFVPVLLANLINLPIEKAINHYYYKDAERELAKNPNLVVIGITGSYGKTSTKNVLTQMLSKDFNVLATPESFNTKMGLTRTIREQLRPTHQVFIAEMGAKEVGDIKELCDFVHPSMGVITSIGPQHLETFKSLENVIHTKGELFASLPEGGVAFRNLDDENIAKLPFREDIETLTYAVKDDSHSEKSQARYLIEDISLSHHGSSFTLKDNQTHKRVRLSTKLLGRHNLSNILAGISIALKLGVPMERLNTLTSEVKPVPHRLSTRVVADTYTVIDDAFNSNPVGSKMALEVLQAFEGKRKIIITPGMVELGSEQDQLNEKLGEYIAQACDYVILVGVAQTQPIQKGLNNKHYPEAQIYLAKDLNDAFAALGRYVAKGDVVLIENDLPDTFNESI